MMSKNSSTSQFWLILAILIGFATTSCQSSKEQKILSKFADSQPTSMIEKTLEIDGATIYYRFIPASPWSICEPGYKWSVQNSDYIKVHIDGTEIVFWRSMGNLNAIPSPMADGKKFMERWRTYSDTKDDSRAQALQLIKIAQIQAKAQAKEAKLAKN